MKQFRFWTIDEITLMIELTNQYTGLQISWNRISQHFKTRSSQQCKSYFNNRMKQFTLQKLILDKNIGAQSLLVSEKDNNITKHICLLSIFNQCQTHIQNIDKKFFFDLNILKLIRSVILAYIENNIDTFAFKNKTILLSENTLNPDQIIQIANFMNSFDYNELLKKITKLIFIPHKTE
ncbi:Myb-like_DNA-binding domain-containing protein [Hexamita inflata]|uniref:Myb-like DNA-binding domain-containing protein n=1 Tax=Hexamita inflata TaxID=28002 RepID=A0AA86U364_9EUKA|nr:Myb-like DNA-binding domain-containing protein [Hexamita inflata]